MKYLSLFALMMLFAACDPRAKLSVENPHVEYESEKTEDNFFAKLGRWTSLDTVYLDVMIDDCGEWGGPRERFSLYKDSTKTLKLNCIRHRFNCDSLSHYYLKPKPLEYNKTIVLDVAKKKVIGDFFMDIMEEKINEKPSDYANHFFLHTNDSTLIIKVKSKELNLENKFYSFKKNLGLPENKNKERVSIPIE